MFDINNLIIDHALRGTMFDKTTGDVIFSITQPKDPSLECSGETVFVTDAIGSKIAGFDRSKDATLSGSNAIIDLGLLAAQLGSDKAVADSSNKIVVPKLEEVAATDGSESKKVLKLAKTPVGTSGAEIKFIYKINKDKSMGTKFEVGTEDTNFKIDAATKTITLPTSGYTYADGDAFYVWYSYEADGTAGNGAVEIVDSATAFAKAGRFDLEVIFCDICDTNNKYYGHVIFENAKMGNAVTININNEADHGFTINCQQDYCATDKRLFRIVIPE